MSNYAQITFFTPKDSLPTSDPNKTIFGATIDPELSAISTAIASKADTAVLVGYAQLSVANVFTQVNTFAGIIVTGATVPANGMYLSAANTLALASNTIKRWSVNSTGNHIFVAPSSGIAVVLNGLTTALDLEVTGNNPLIINTTAVNGGFLVFKNSGTNAGFVGTGASTITGAALADLGIAAAGGGVLRLGLAGGAATALAIATTGAVSISAPTAGAALTVNLLAGQFGLVVSGDGNSQYMMQLNSASAISGRNAISFVNSGVVTQSWALGVDATGGSAGQFLLRNITAGTVPLSVTADGHVNIAAPTATATPTLVVNGALARTSFQLLPADSASVGMEIADPGANNTLLRLNTTNAVVNLQALGTSTLLNLQATAGVRVVAPTVASSVALLVSGISGTHSTKIADSATASFNAGFLEIPQNIQNVAYAPVLADSGKHIYHSDASARTYTIPANGTVAYPIGTTLTFVNDASAAVNVTIAITTDTLVWAATGGTGSRTLAQFGTATALKVTATRWVISGTGLT